MTDYLDCPAIGKKIRKLRAEKRWTQGRLAKESGVTQQTICAAETGRRFPNVASINGIARALGVTPGYLYDN